MSQIGTNPTTDVVWVLDLGKAKEAQVQSYPPASANVPTWEGTLDPPGEYDRTIHLRLQRGLVKLV